MICRRFVVPMFVFLSTPVTLVAEPTPSTDRATAPVEDERAEEKKANEENAPVDKREGIVQYVDVETEPVAYLLRGAGGTVGVMFSDWQLSLEVFEVRLPEAMHGHEGLQVSTLGAELQAEWFFGDGAEGWFAGPEVGVGRTTVTNTASGAAGQQVGYSVGIRGGYRWYPGLGNFFVSPQGGLGYSLNETEIHAGGRVFDGGSLPVTPWVTVGLGWSFGR